MNEEKRNLVPCLNITKKNYLNFLAAKFQFSRRNVCKKGKILLIFFRDEQKQNDTTFPDQTLNIIPDLDKTMHSTLKLGKVKTT